MRKLVTLTAVLAALAFAPAAEAAIPNVFGDVSCADDAAGLRVCGGVTKTFDDTNIDVNVIFPKAAEGDGPFPAIGWFHGWGGSKLGVSGGNASGRAKDWAERGYAVFSMSDRGWGSSCGGQDPQRTTDPAGCAEGYNHLMDTRFEVRDAQFLFGKLADENRVVGDRIGVTGGSYGGGISMALAALRNRVMMPDDSLVPWTSPSGKPMEIAVAAPEIPWTDLAYALTPNGRNLDYVADNTYLGPSGDYPVGVSKQSWIALLYGAGAALSNYAPPGTDGDADLTTWFAAINAGEPYEQNPLTADLVDEVTTHHSSYYIERNGTAPAPLLISNGWTDDLFPADEAIRFYNRTLTEFPGHDVSLFFLDYGHARGAGKDADTAKLHDAQEAWFDHYLKGVGAKPAQGVTAITQTCPEDAASAGPFTASDWQGLSRGEVVFYETSSKTIVPGGGNSADGQTYDPTAGGGDPCATTTGPDRPGTATYALPAAKDGGYTLLGSPTVLADISSTSPTSQMAARLLDVSPEGDRTLVARGLYRPDSDGRQVFQLHPNGWKFEDGHVPALELLPNDTPYGRSSNGQGPITVENLVLRVPALEPAGAAGGVVSEPRPNVLPAGAAPAPGVTAAGACESGLTMKGTKRKDTITGSAGGDNLKGGAGNDRISGKDGDDCLKGNRGKDRIRGGKGDDKVKSRDGERDRVACGPGDRDKVVADREDKLRGCEKKKRR